MMQRRRMGWRGAVALGVLVVLAGCASPRQAAAPGAVAASATPSSAMPLLRLAPAALGRTLALQQQLSVRGPDGTQRHLQALLEADARELRIALTSMGQVLARMRWDGAQLDVQRSRHWPEQVAPERILSDLQLALWPVAQIAAALPPDWQLLASADGTRRLLQAGSTRIEVREPNPGVTEIDYLQEGWQLRIETQALPQGQP